MNLSDIVSTLDRKGLIVPSRQRPFEESLDRWDRFPIQWDAFSPGSASKGGFGNSRDEAPRQRWQAVAERIEEAGQISLHRQPDNVDALAWYLPFHRYGMDSGIYIKEDGILDTAGRIRAHLMAPSDPIHLAKQLVHQATAILFFHEMFHHRIESFATRLEIARGCPVYIPYEQNVFLPLIGTDGLLEEAYACAEMLSRLNESRYRKGIDKPIVAATRDFLMSWIPGLPPGYRLGIEAYYVKRIGELLSQVAEASALPKHSKDEWKIVQDMTRGFLNVDSIVRVVVPLGTSPVIPWVDTSL